MTSNCLPHQARRPADRQLARLLLKCMHKLLKALAMPREVDKLGTISLPSVLAQLHDLSLLAPPSPTGDVSFSLDLMKATEEVLCVLVDGHGAAALKAAIPKGAEEGGIALWINQRLAEAPETALRVVPPPAAPPPAAPPPAAPPPAAPLAAPLPSVPLEPMQLGAAFDQAAPSPAPKAGAPTTAPTAVAPSPRQRSSSAPVPLKSPSAAAAPVAKSPRSVARSPRPLATRPATAASATAGVESVAATARAKLEAMKRKYNITTAHSAAAPATAAATAAAAAAAAATAAAATAPAAGAVATAAVAPVGAEAGMGGAEAGMGAGMGASVAEGAPAAGVAGTTSPSLNVAALKSRLARLRARP
eukprot:jgi/Chrpa1/529/Chrysochromulina_OHIO_Genome00013375-RA